MGGADLASVYAAHRVAVAYLFGSRAEGLARPDSDHDIAVLFADAEPAQDATVRLGRDLAAELATPVDVVDLDRGTLELRGRVANTGHRLYSGDEVRRVRFEADARNRWTEFAPVPVETTRCFLQRVATEGLRWWCGIAEGGLVLDSDRPKTFVVSDEETARQYASVGRGRRA